MSENKTGKYIKYALGEILLVMIGILLALQVNNWNEDRKFKAIEKEIYNNLITSLQKDSIELKRIINFQSRSLRCQKSIITNSFVSLRDSLGSTNRLGSVIKDIDLGGISFFPKYGAYNTIISESRMQIIKSDSLKSMLIELYDYKYKRYQSVDNILDEKYFNELDPFLIEKIGLIEGEFGYFLKGIDVKLLEKNYNELVEECGKLSKLSYASFHQLNTMSDDVNRLLVVLNKEISNI